MKRTAILLLAAFYLLLASGMYLCAVHCSITKLVMQPEMQMAGTPGCSKPCCADKQRSCTKKHGNFTIKENVKPGYQMRFHLPLLTLAPLPLHSYTPNAFTAVYNTPYTNSKAPPGTSGKALSIKFRSLLI